MELTDAQLVALLRQTDEAWVESTNIEQLTPNIDAVLDATEGIVAEVRSLRARIAAADQLHRPHNCDDGDGMCCWAEEVPGEGYMCQLVGTCDHDGYLWPCPTHTALHPEETDHA